MKRRTVLLGLGSAAVGSATVFGSGAFTQVSADRSVTIGIDTDSEALLALVPNEDIDSIEEVEGELTIDSEKLSEDSEGFNVGTLVEIGATDEDEVVDGEEAFTIVNNFDASVTITIDLTDEAFDGGSGELTFRTTRSDTEENDSVTADEDGELTLEGVESGAEVRVALEIETESTDDPEDLSGTVVFSAVPSGDVPPPDVDTVTNEDTGETYGTIGEAVDDAEENETILVPSGTYEDESVEVNVDGVTIRGVTNENSTIAANEGPPTVKIDDDDKPAFEIRAEDVTIDAINITVSEGDVPPDRGNLINAGVGVLNSGANIQNLTIESENARIPGIVVDDIEHPVTDVFIKHVTVTSFSTFGSLEANPHNGEPGSGIQIEIEKDRSDVIIEGGETRGNDFGIRLDSPEREQIEVELAPEPVPFGSVTITDVTFGQNFFTDVIVQTIESSEQPTIERNRFSVSDTYLGDSNDFEFSANLSLEDIRDENDFEDDEGNEKETEIDEQRDDGDELLAKALIRKQ